MTTFPKRKIFAICGSTRKNSTNVQILHVIAGLYEASLEVEIYDKIAQLPHFDPDQTDNAPEVVSAFRKSIEEADGVLICTPEYVFSLPGSLKNALEWTVSTVVLSNKPVAFVVASAGGARAFESLDLIMETLTQQPVPPECKLLISGGRGKINKTDGSVDDNTLAQLKNLTDALLRLMEKSKQP